jgi:photosystem II stability/assembly factor-like uncharacterized protein
MFGLIIAMQNQLLVVSDPDGSAHIDSKLQNTRPQSLASDPFVPGRIYAATFGNGLWVTENSGEDWERIGGGSLLREITSVAVDQTQQNGEYGTVYAGTEPSNIYRSNDGGETWLRAGDLTKLSSSDSWSFPPRPDTHHVRFIASDPIRSGLIYAAIEAGALIRTWDSGETWKDRVDTGPYDTHTLATNPKAPGKIYSAAGDGYFESMDYGDSWQRLTSGLGHHYLYCVGVHPSDPDTVLVSASPGPWSAYNPDHAESYAYRKTGEGFWKGVRLDPESERSTVSVFIPNPGVSGEFYAVNSLGIYHSFDAGAIWEKLLPWPDTLRQNVWGVALIDE